MKTKLQSVVLALGLLPASVALGIDKGEIMPKIDINHMENGVLNNATFTGKVTVVNFWATWCAACKVEIKEMERAFVRLLDDERFQLAFVSLDKDPVKAQQWFDANVDLEDFKKKLYKDPEFKIAELLDVDSFPMTLIIDGAGKVVHVQRGFKEGEGTTEKIASYAESMLNL